MRSLLKIKVALTQLAAGLGLLTMLASGASAQTTPTAQLFSGGSYFDAPLLRALFDCYGIPVPSTNTRAAACPTAVEPIQIFYAGIGTGAGVENFINQNSNATGSILVLPPFTDPGTGVNSYPYTRPDGGIVPDFVGIAGALSSTEDGAYSRLTQLKRGRYSRLPVDVGPLALPYSSTSNGTAALPAGLNLTRAQYCDIWAGRVINWNQLTLLAADGTPIGIGPNLPIVRVVRADTSGATYAFTQHLIQACQDLDGDGVLESSFPWTVPFSDRSTWGISEYSTNSRVLSGNGAPRLIQTILLTPGSIGYVSASVTQPHFPTGPLAASLQNAYSAHSIATGGSTYEFLQPTSIAASKALALATDIYTIGSKLKDPSVSGAYPITAPNYVMLYCRYDAMKVAGVPQGISTFLKNLFGWIFVDDPDGTPNTADDPVADQVAISQVYFPLTNALKSQARRALAAIDTPTCRGNGPFGPS